MLQEVFSALTWKAVFVWFHRITVLYLLRAAVHSALFLLRFLAFPLSFLFLLMQLVLSSDSSFSLWYLLGLSKESFITQI